MDPRNFEIDSLSRQMEAGPPVQNNLVQILIRIRRFRVGLQVDISKMIEMSLDLFGESWGLCMHHKYSASKEYALGLLTTPFLAMSVIRYHALNHLQGFPLGANQILENMLDELVDAKEIVIELMALMTKRRIPSD
ncbi:hypothetical protein T10_5000 [Trichinella papuae]|uniref:Uncharacterized protein n=1 Tax=Trichinella papuae TaxID=268474 RepID=A0A0V1M0V9_9BILA|nr:hypothetical protein T10_5000 [Trichinella papuae]